MIKLDPNIKNVLYQLIDLYYQDDYEKKVRIFNYDVDLIRELGTICSKSFTPDEVLEVFNQEELDMVSVEYLKKMAKKRKMAEMLYKILIGNLNKDDEELETGLELLGLRINKEKEYKLELIKK